MAVSTNEVEKPDFQIQNFAFVWNFVTQRVISHFILEKNGEEISEVHKRKSIYSSYSLK